MATLESLLTELAALDAQQDFDEMKRLREQIVRDHSEADEAVEALYKLGLDALFRQRALPAAIEFFKEAADRKHAFWSAAARTSLGLCFYHQRKFQKAVFELRRVGYTKTPTAHSVSALTFLHSILEEEGKLEEAGRVLKERISQLEGLIEVSREESGSAADRGYNLYMLGLSYRDFGEVEKGNEALEEAKNLGPDVIGAELYASVVDALSS